MATRTYFDRMMPRRSLGGFYTASLSSLNDPNTYSEAVRRLVRTTTSFETSSLPYYQYITFTLLLFMPMLFIVDDQLH